MAPNQIKTDYIDKTVTSEKQEVPEQTQTDPNDQPATPEVDIKTDLAEQNAKFEEQEAQDATQTDPTNQTDVFEQQIEIEETKTEQQIETEETKTDPVD